MSFRLQVVNVVCLRHDFGLDWATICALFPVCCLGAVVMCVSCCFALLRLFLPLTCSSWFADLATYWFRLLAWGV